VTFHVSSCMSTATPGGLAVSRGAFRWIASFAVVLWLLLPLIGVADVTPPLELVKETTARIQQAMHDNKADIDRDVNHLYALITQIALPHFDFHRMSMWTLGPYWRSATPAQREQFLDEFRRLLLRTYGHTLLDYRDAKIRYLPVLADPDARQVYVRCEVEQPDGNPVRLVYAMYRTAEGWKVYDVLVEGVSLVTNYRSSFAAIVQQQGMDGLIKRLAAKNQESGP
jgi:phospholipid transport system substrate-binding protein